jgi:hypothetical protein
MREEQYNVILVEAMCSACLAKTPGSPHSAALLPIHLITVPFNSLQNVGKLNQGFSTLHHHHYK